MNISFETSLIATTEAPQLINIQDFMKEYDILPTTGEQRATTMTYVNNGGALINHLLISGSSFGNPTFTDVFNVAKMTASIIEGVVPGLNEDVNLYSILLGQSDDYQTQIWLKCDLTQTASASNNIQVDVHIYVMINVTGQQPTNIDIATEHRQLSRASTVLVAMENLGIGLLKFPGRDEGIEHMGLCVFYGWTTNPTTLTTLRMSGTHSDSPPQTDFSIGIGNQWYPSSGAERSVLGAIIDLEAVEDLWNVHFLYRHDSPEAGEPSEEGGYGEGDPSFDDSSDSVGIPITPPIGVTDVGFVNVYKTESGGLQSMGIELFPPLAYTQPAQIPSTDSVSTAIVNGVNAFMTFLANIPSFFAQMTANTLINYIIDCHVLPVTPNTAVQPTPIEVGPKQLETTGYKVTSDYVDVTCGTLSLREYYANFADFLTTFKLYLPFVGFVPARPEWFYRENLEVVYRFNVIDGSFMAYVLSTGAYVNNHNSGKTIVGQYGGVACIHIPITGVTYSSMVSGLLGAGAGMAAGVAASSVPALATSALAAAGAHGDIAQSNSYSSSVAFLGCRRPFALIERPVSNFSETYAREKGIPSNISHRLSDVTGFSVIGDVHLDGISATDAEKLEIERLLHEGVIL